MAGEGQCSVSLELSRPDAWRAGMRVRPVLAGGKRARIALHGLERTVLCDTSLDPVPLPGILG